MTDYQILYQDKDLVLVNKPSGVVVNQADTFSGETIQAWFRQYLAKQGPMSQKDWQALVPGDFNDQYGTPEEIFAGRAGLVHRLDKETSGVLLLATNPGSLVNLLAQFKNRQTTKTYSCLVHGKLNPKEGIIDAPLARSSKDRKKFAVVATGRSAKTYYQVLKEFSAQNLIDTLVEKRINDKTLDPLEKKALNNKNLRMYEAGFSLVSCQPKTGRTHQIRVHLKNLGNSLVGDQTYSGKKRAKVDRIWCPRQFLHAAKLEFTHPRTQQTLKIEAELTPDLQKVLKLL